MMKLMKNNTLNLFLLVYLKKFYYFELFI